MGWAGRQGDPVDASRREFVRQVVAASLLPMGGKDFRSPLSVPDMTSRSPDWRSHFPALDQTINGHPLAYLDTAATAQRPKAVTDAVVDFYERDNANPGRT